MGCAAIDVCRVAGKVTRSDCGRAEAAMQAAAGRTGAHAAWGGHGCFAELWLGLGRGRRLAEVTLGNCPPNDTRMTDNAARGVGPDLRTDLRADALCGAYSGRPLIARMPPGRMMWLSCLAR